MLSRQNRESKYRVRFFFLAWITLATQHKSTKLDLGVSNLLNSSKSQRQTVEWCRISQFSVDLDQYNNTCERWSKEEYGKNYFADRNLRASCALFFFFFIVLFFLLLLFFFFFLFVHSQTEPSTTQGKTPILLLKSLFRNRYFFFQFLLVSFNNDGFSLHKSHILSAVVRTTTFVLFYIIFLAIKSSCILYLYLFLLNNQLLQNFLIKSLGAGNHIGMRRQVRLS